MSLKHSNYFETEGKKLIEKNLLLEDTFTFYMHIFNNFDNSIETFDWDIKNNPFIIFDKLPALKPDNLVLPENGTVEKSLKKTINIIEKTHPGINIGDPLSGIINNRPALENAVRLLLKKEVDSLKIISDDLKIGNEEFIFTLLNSIKPYTVSLATSCEDRLRTIDYSLWTEAICPFCGYFADISKIVDSRENIRILHCGLCENEWQYKRLKCTICGNEDHESMGYYTFDDDDRYRFDYCSRCKGYIKTIRIRNQFDESSIDLAAENILTGFLDASAIDMGYGRP